MIKDDITPISIIIPVYNAEEYISRCIDSITHQIFMDYEVICIDDGSIDNSGLILDQYAERDRRIRVIHTENCGIASARNTGMINSSGNWIYFMDADDWIESELLHQFFLFISDIKVDMVVFDFYLHHRKGCVKKKTLPLESTVILEHFSKCRLLADYMKVTQAVWNKFFLREFLVRNQIIFVNLYHADDVLFSLTAYAIAKRIGYLDYAGYHYVKNEGSITSRFSDKQPEMWIGLYEEEKKLKQYFNQNEYMKFINTQLINSLIVIGYRYTFHPDHFLPFCEKVKELRAMIQSYPFSDALCNYNKMYLGKSAKLYMVLGYPRISMIFLISTLKRRLQK